MSLTFRGIDSAGFGGYALTDQLLYNLKWWVDWNLLNNGAYGIYEYDSASWYDDDESKLHPVSDERYVAGRVWNGAGREWVWESGVSLGGGAVDPFRVSGVYIESDFYPISETGINQHHVDYQHGRIIFDEPKSSTDDIRAEYTRRSVYVGFADEPDFRVLMLDAIEEFLTDSSTSGTPSREHQIWLPSIFIEVTSTGKGRGLELGGGQIKEIYVTFHIFADNPQDRNLLKDWLDYQSRTTFWMADLNAITMPFDVYGDIVPGVTNWVNMVATNPWKRLRVMNSIATTLNSLNSQLFRARVVFEIEVDFKGI
ncbi:hypothetical protein LCGC14_0141170 [marine sediment metagenome]|uniref:Uncharacterized protein n=1 Tax=marine sediment metagenome TaxID=412755 RepID=A0A0F9XI81_9ZZZZ